MTGRPRQCYYCNAGDVRQELRPYGPGGAPVCHACVSDPAHPERQDAAAAMFTEEQRRDNQETSVAARLKLLFPKFRSDEP
jgi:hypothetical protein